jgi:hypothetical protein
MTPGMSMIHLLIEIIESQKILEIKKTLSPYLNPSSELLSAFKRINNSLNIYQTATIDS